FILLYIFYFQNLLTYNCKDVAFAHYKIIFTIYCNFGSAVFSIKNFITDFNTHFYCFTVVSHFARAGGYNSSFNRFFFSSIGKNNTALCLFFSFTWLYYNPVCQG